MQHLLLNARLDTPQTLLDNRTCCDRTIGPLPHLGQTGLKLANRCMNAARANPQKEANTKSQYDPKNSHQNMVCKRLHLLLFFAPVAAPILRLALLVNPVIAWTLQNTVVLELEKATVAQHGFVADTWCFCLQL